MCRLRCKKGDFVELAYEEKCYISKIEGSSSVSRVYGKVLDDRVLIYVTKKCSYNPR